MEMTLPLLTACVDRGGRVGTECRQPTGKRSRQGRVGVVILQARRLVQRHGRSGE